MSILARAFVLLYFLLATCETFQDVKTPLDPEIIAISFPEDQSSDPNAKPCFKFSGQVHFIISYAIKDASRASGQKEKMVEFDLPPVSQDMISGSCASPSFTYISSTFRASAEQDFNCRMDVNFTLVENNVDNTTTAATTATTTPLNSNSVPVVMLDKIQLDCDVKEALNSVKATFDTPIELNPANTSLQCDSTIKIDLSPSIMVTFRSLRLQAFNLPASKEFSPASHCISDIDRGLVSTAKTINKLQQVSNLATNPAPSTGTTNTAENLNRETSSDRSVTSTSSPVMPQTTKLALGPSVTRSDVRLLFSETGSMAQDTLNINSTYVAQHGDPAVNGKLYTDTTTTQTTSTTTVPTESTTTSTTTSSSTTQISTTQSTLNPITTTINPTPATVPPNVVPAVGHWTLNRTRPDGLPTNETCLILETSLVMEITYEAAFPKPNSTVVEYKNKTVKIALPPQPLTRASGLCSAGRIQMITLQFNVTSYPWSLVLEFLDGPHNKTRAARRSIRDLANLIAFGNASGNSTVDPGHYVLDAVRLHYDTHSFTDAVNQEKFKLAATGIKMFHAKSGKATFCNSEQKVVLSPSVSLRTYNFKARPFITNPNQTSFGEAEQCAADRLTSDIVPIAVGCALAALIVVVLIAYAVGRYRRRRQGYQTVE